MKPTAVGVQFKKTSQVYYYYCEKYCKVGDSVVVESPSTGLEVVTLVQVCTGDNPYAGKVLPTKYIIDVIDDRPIKLAKARARVEKASKALLNSQKHYEAILEEHRKAHEELSQYE